MRNMKNMKKLLILAAAGAGMLLCAQEYKDNFSEVKTLCDGRAGYVIWGDHSYIKACRYDPAVGRQAPGSLRIAAEGFDKPGSGFFVRVLPVETGKQYNLMVYCRKSEASPEAGVEIRLIGKDAAQKTIYRFSRVKCDTFEDGAWKKLQLSIGPIPEGGKKEVTIEFGAVKLQRGSIWFDDLEFFPEE